MARAIHNHLTIKHTYLPKALDIIASSLPISMSSNEPKRRISPCRRQYLFNKLFEGVYRVYIGYVSGV